MATKKRKKRRKRSPNGSIQLMENGKYYARLSLGFTGTKYVYKSITGNTKADVKAQISQLKLIYGSSEITEESLMTLGEWLDYWLQEIKKPMLGYTTYDNYKSFIDKHIKPLIGYKKLIHITREDVERFVERMQLSYISNKEKQTRKQLALLYFLQL